MTSTAGTHSKPTQQCAEPSLQTHKGLNAANSVNTPSWGDLALPTLRFGSTSKVPAKACVKALQEPTVFPGGSDADIVCSTDAAFRQLAACSRLLDVPRMCRPQLADLHTAHHTAWRMPGPQLGGDGAHLKDLIWSPVDPPATLLRMLLPPHLRLCACCRFLHTTRKTS